MPISSSTGSAFRVSLSGRQPALETGQKNPLTTRTAVQGVTGPDRVSLSSTARQLARQLAAGESSNIEGVSELLPAPVIPENSPASHRVLPPVVQRPDIILNPEKTNSSREDLSSPPNSKPGGLLNTRA